MSHALTTYFNLSSIYLLFVKPLVISNLDIECPFNILTLQRPWLLQNLMDLYYSISIASQPRASMSFFSRDFMSLIKLF